MDNWILHYANAVTELSRLLGLRFIWDGGEYKSVGARTPIGESVMMIGVFHNELDYASRDVEIAKLTMLVKDLQTIERHDQLLLSSFKKIIRNTSKNWGTYFGVRIEIKIAASLIQKEIDFIKAESPDFTIPKYGVCIECTNTHRTNNGSANLVDKIRSAITQKSRKSYCNSSTILCMDITNIAATYEKEEEELLSAKNALRNVVQQILKDTNSNYGSILIFSYFMDLKNNYHSGYWRIDNENPTQALLDFLDKYFPIGEFKTGPGWTPKAG
ncbi:MAG: hypothetical protein AABZ77_00145 [Chloroflexota bacterium]